MLFLTNIGFGQCFSFGFRKVNYTLLQRSQFSQNFVLRVLSHKHRVCAVLLPRQVCCMLVFILLYSVILCFVCFASPTSGLCSAFPFGFPQVYTLLVFFVLISLLLLCVLCPTTSGLCRDFSPAPLEFARFNFCFVSFNFKFVFCFFPLTNLIFLRFP